MFIDVRPDLSIEVKHIEAVESLDELNSIIYTSRHSYKVAMPKSVILSMITSRQKQGGESGMGNVEKLLQQIYQGQTSPRV